MSLLHTIPEEISRHAWINIITQEMADGLAKFVVRYNNKHKVTVHINSFGSWHVTYLNATILQDMNFNKRSITDWAKYPDDISNFDWNLIYVHEE